MEKAKQQIKIDKNIPRPSGAAARSKYPFADMEVGDSFFLSAPPSTIAPQAYKFGRLTNRKFSALKVDGGSRVWRTA